MAGMKAEDPPFISPLIKGGYGGIKAKAEAKVEEIMR
jgi:hypothetical protein